MPSLDAAQGHEPHEAAGALALKLAESRVSATAAKRPGIVAEYALYVSRLFRTFYRHCPVLNAGTAAATAFRLHRCQATHRVLVHDCSIYAASRPPEGMHAVAERHPRAGRQPRARCEA